MALSYHYHDQGNENIHHLQKFPWVPLLVLFVCLYFFWVLTVWVCLLLGGGTLNMTSTLLTNVCVHSTLLVTVSILL